MGHTKLTVSFSSDEKGIWRLNIKIERYNCSMLAVHISNFKSCNNSASTMPHCPMYTLASDSGLRLDYHIAKTWAHVASHCSYSIKRHIQMLWGWSYQVSLFPYSRRWLSISKSGEGWSRQLIAAVWTTNMAKTIVCCFDGTGNQFGQVGIYLHASVGGGVWEWGCLQCINTVALQEVTS